MKVLLSAPRAGKSFIARLAARGAARVPACLLIVALLTPLTASLATKESAVTLAALAPASAMITGNSRSETAGSTGSNNATNVSAALAAPPPPTGRTAFDFDGDGKADAAVWRPATGIWLVLQSSTGTVTSQQWGTAGDRIVPGDYDNDGRTDYAVYTPSSGMWNILKSSNGQTFTYSWGAPGDVPVPGDYDGDGSADLAVWRPSDGNWYILKSSDGNSYGVQFGNDQLGDAPMAGDYDGDGKTDIAVRRSRTGVWYVQQSSNGEITTLQWGMSTDIAVPADYDGDAKTDYAVWRASGDPAAAGEWYVLTSLAGTVLYSQFGSSNPPDVLVPADYDGDGKADFAVWRPSEGSWYIWQSGSSSVAYQPHGVAGDIPVPAVFINQTIPTTTASPTPTPTPTGTLQLSKEYIYAGSRMLAVEDANAQP